MTDTDMSDDVTPTSTPIPSKKGPSDGDGPKNKDGSSLPWVEKYRPSKLDDLISHKEIIQTITNLINANKLPHLLLYGPPGTGKTSTILAMARRLYGDSYSSQILELNASDDRGIDVVREQIKDFASSRAMFNPTGFKLILLDEADSMTKAAQFALRRVIEKYTRNARFCLICNYISKIIPALQSRCTRFRFTPLDSQQQETRLQTIVQQEGVNITPDGMRAIIQLSDGDMRKCLNVLQACHIAYPIVSETNVYLSTGNPLPSDIQIILQLLMNTNMEEAVRTIGNMQIEKGLSLSDIVRYVSDFLPRVSLPPLIRMQLLSDLADLEYRLSFGTNEKLQLSSFVGMFVLAREEINKYINK